jgi:hypothetical protein
MPLHHVKHGYIGTVGFNSGYRASGFAAFTTFTALAAFTTGRKVAERSAAFTALSFTTLTTVAFAAFATVMLAFFTALSGSLFTTFAALVFATLTALGFTMRAGGHHFVAVLVSDGAGACQQCRNTDSGPEFHVLIGHRVLPKQAARAHPIAVRLMVVPWCCMMRQD